MIDLQILKDKGLTAENLKTWLNGDPRDWTAISLDPNTKDQGAVKQRAALWNRIKSRIAEGQQRNFNDYRVFHALDQAWAQPFYQITPTLVAKFIDSDPNNDDVYKQIQSWGLTQFIIDEKDEKSGKVTHKMNLPVFFNVFVPLVRAYVTIRWAKIMNDRNQSPFFKVEPFKQTTPLRIKCEALTDRMNVMSNQYGYYDVMKQAVLKMLHYSYCLQFVEKEWDYESQWRTATAEDVAMGKKKPRTDPLPPDAVKSEDDDDSVPVVEGDVIKVTTREGLTYHHPHPSRTFWDLAHGKYTYNYDYGCKFAGYWKIVRWGEILDGDFWNKDKVVLGSADIVSQQKTFFETVYPCNLNCPVYAPPAPITQDGSGMGASMGTGVSPLDREKQISTQYYGHEVRDQGVLITEYYEKLVPKDNGLGEYDCPVWMRFTVAGDGQTILYAAPLPYNPVIYYGYDADESLAKNPSLSLEVLPFQDHFSNVLTQILLTAKQNLANVTLVDTDQVEPQSQSKIENLGNRLFTALNIFGFSSKKSFRSQQRTADAVQSFNLPKGNVAELTNVLKTILDVLERILVMSSHEVAQAASHEQTKEEVKTISGSTTTRLQFTAKPVDIAASAWKRQLYQGLMAYGDDDMWAHLPSDIPLTKEVLNKMGFSYLDTDTSIGRDRFRRVKFNKDAVALDMWQFASTRDDTDRSNDTVTAQGMSAIIKDVMANPMLAQAIGTDQMIDWINAIVRLAGLPRDMKFRNMAPEADEAAKRAQAEEQLKQVVQIVQDEVHKDLKVAMTPLLEETSRLSKEMGLVMQALQHAPPAPNSTNGAPEMPEMMRQ